MNDHFLLEAAWVLFAYGLKYVIVGLIIALIMVVPGSRGQKRWARISILGSAVLILWIAIFIGVDSGYRAWQSIPNPPEEAFSDTGGPFAALFVGWLPGLAVLGTAHLLLRRIWNGSAKD